MDTQQDHAAQYALPRSAPWPLRVKIAIRVWRLIEAILFRLTPCRMNPLRRLLLRAFGASMARTAWTHPTCRVYCPWNLVMGERSSIDEECWIRTVEKVIIGHSTCISRRVEIQTGTHDISDPHFGLITKPVHIGDRVWIGASATILPGVTIGDGAVVGACAVVTKDVPAWTVVAGNPAREIKKRVLRPCGPIPPAPFPTGKRGE